MKKLLLILLSALSLTAVAEEMKTVAVLDPICRDNSVSGFYQLTVRGAMETAITISEEYEAYDRAAFDLIQKEQAFQHNGNVSDKQIRQMGEMAGVDYVLVSEVSAEAGYLTAVFKILNVTTGKYDKTVNDLMELDPKKVKSKCEEKAASLFSTSQNSSRTAASSSLIPQTSAKPAQKGSVTTPAPAVPDPVSRDPNEYVDLGLPSGTLWKAENEDCGLIPNEKATSFYGSNLPTIKQWDEIVHSCIWTWTGNGYNVMGPNRQTIFFPAEGIEKYSKKIGGYWSSTPVEVNKESFPKLKDHDIAAMNQLSVSAGGLWGCLKFDSKSVTVHQMFGNTRLSIRLVR